MTNRIPGSSETAPIASNASSPPALTTPTAQALQREMRSAEPNWDRVHDLLSTYRSLSPEARAEVRDVIVAERIAPRAHAEQEDSGWEIFGKILAFILGIIPGIIWVAVDEAKEGGARRSEEDARVIQDGILDLQPPPARPSLPEPPPAPVVENGPTVSAQQLSAMATRLRGVTESQINGVDVFALIFTVGMSSEFTWERKAGSLTQREAQDLVAAGRQAPPEEQRVLAMALRAFLDSGDRVDLHDDGRAVVRAFIDEVERNNPPTPADRAAGNLVANLDFVALALEKARTEFGGIVRDRERATRDGRPAPEVRELRIDGLNAELVNQMRTALARLPPELREAAKTYLRTQLDRTVVPPGVTEPAALRDLRALATAPATS